MDDLAVINYKRENPKRNVAVVGLRDSMGKILLVRTHKLPKSWQPVGGGIDTEDTAPEFAAIREVKEEIGVDLSSSTLKLKLTVPYDFGEGIVYFYEALVADNTNINTDPVEILEHRWFSLSDVGSLMTFPATKKFLKLLISEEGYKRK